MTLNFIVVTLINSTIMKASLDTTQLEKFHSRMQLLNGWTRLSWRERVACFRMLGCLKISRLRQSILIAIWSIVLHLLLLNIKLFIRYGLVFLLIIRIWKHLILLVIVMYMRVNLSLEQIKWYRLWCSYPKSPKYSQWGCCVLKNLSYFT